MIDFETLIFSRIANKLREDDPGMFVSGEYVKAPADFPAVMIEEKGNSTYQRTQDSGNLENHASLMYEVNIFSNKRVGKKSQCKELFAIVDGEFKDMGFTRIMKEPVPNLEDGTVYRLIGRYTAVMSTGGIIFRR